MEWQDNAIILSARKHGETSLLLHVFASKHGRHGGLIKGGASAKSRAGLIQPGTKANLAWRGRLPVHLGHFRIHSLETKILPTIFNDPQKVLAVQSFCTLLNLLLPEGEDYPLLYQKSDYFLGALNAPDWLVVYILWEMHFLSAIGYGLDLSRCAGGENNSALIWVSPKSGCAVSEKAGAPWHNQLLPLPPFLLGQEDKNISSAELQAGLNLTGFFIERVLQRLSKHHLPECRQRLVNS
jgi:DNA repair protein RecO (recombination protein O)